MLLHPLNPTGLENHLASLQPLMWFLRAVRAASASVTCGPPRGSDARDILFFAVGKITLAYRHRRLRSRQHATGNITTHTSPAASYALVRLRPPSYGRSPPESWPFMPALGILWLSTTNLFFNNLMSFCSYSPPLVWGLHGHLCDQFLFLMLTHVPCGDMWYLWTIHALNRIGARICVSLL